MHINKLKTFFVAQLLFISGIQSRKSSTCGDLEREINGHSDEIAKLKLQLIKYETPEDPSEEYDDRCNSFSTCSECVHSPDEGDTECGWCFQSNKCSLEENCFQTINLYSEVRSGNSKPDVWIPRGTNKCPKITAVKPNLLAFDTHQTLDVIITDMPKYNKTLICSFEILGRTVIKRGRQTDEGVSCPSHFSDEAFPFMENEKHVPVTLSIEILLSNSNYRNPSIVSTTNLTLFNCHRYSSCTECTSSSFPCDWCSAAHRCTHEAKNCRNDIIISNKAVHKQSIRPGPEHCARILPYPSGRSNEILVPSGLKKRISLKEENILRFQVSTRFYCKVKGHPRVEARLLGDVIYCDSIKFQVIDRNPVSNLSFDVYWGGDVKMDNPLNMHAVVYVCSLMATSCGECLDLPLEYNCGWCNEFNSCSMRKSCPESGWLDRTQNCTNPEIISFSPKAGLFTRPTNITIEGINFGKEFKDIDGGVRLIDEDSELISECKAFEDLFVKHSRIVCELDVPQFQTENNRSMQRFFELKVQNEYVTVSGEEYIFVKPSITALEPVKGIKSGGTYLTIQGHHLDAGNIVEAYVGDIPCKIVSRHQSSIRCITSPSPRTRSSAVKVIFDGEEKKSPTYFFYVQDPCICSVKTELNADGPTGTPSGGNLIIVEGEYLDHVRNSYMYLIVDNEEYPGACTVESPSEIKCLSPRVPPELLNFCGEEGFIAFDYGFRMGYLEDVQNISMKEGFNKFRMYPNPFFKPFSEDSLIRVYKSGHLVIEGQNIDFVLNDNDITVEVGVEECTLTSLSLSQLTCHPPPTQPEAKDYDPNKLPEVVVKVRGIHDYFIGFLQYDL